MCTTVLFYQYKDVYDYDYYFWGFYASLLRNFWAPYPFFWLNFSANTSTRGPALKVAVVLLAVLLLALLLLLAQALVVVVVAVVAAAAVRGGASK
jgi:uncharacterized metal-binding protein